MKTVLITGSSRGIGLALAREASKRDYKVILHSANESPELDAAVGELPHAGKVVFDLLDTEAMKAAIDELIEREGKIDICINNAGTLIWKPLLEQSDDEIRQGLRVNLEAPVLLTKYLLPSVNDGFINIVSAASRDDYHGKLDFENETVYAASKFGLRGFSFVLAKEHPNLKVLCVNPGMMATAMTDNVGADPAALAERIFDEYPTVTEPGKWRELNIFW